MRNAARTTLLADVGQARHSCILFEYVGLVTLSSKLGNTYMQRVSIELTSKQLFLPCGLAYPRDQGCLSERYVDLYRYRHGLCAICTKFVDPRSERWADVQLKVAPSRFWQRDRVVWYRIQCVSYYMLLSYEALREEKNERWPEAGLVLEAGATSSDTDITQRASRFLLSLFLWRALFWIKKDHCLCKWKYVNDKICIRTNIGPLIVVSPVVTLFGGYWVR